MLEPFLTIQLENPELRMSNASGKKTLHVGANQLLTHRSLSDPGSFGKRTEARNLLAPVYNWFTEGFDTPVLQETKALLEELST